MLNPFNIAYTFSVYVRLFHLSSSPEHFGKEETGFVLALSSFLLSSLRNRRFSGK
jgi:hypothetical protein